MAVGDLITRDYQYEWRGLLLGSGSQIVTQRVNGLLGLPAVEDRSQDKAHTHGATPGLMVYRKKLVDISGLITGIPGTDIESRIQAVQTAFQLPHRRSIRKAEEFVFQRPGYNGKRFVWARVMNREIPSEYDTARGKGTLEAQLTCADPLVYSLALQTSTWQLPAADASEQRDVTNLGNHSDGADPIITIQGPWTNPRIQNTTDDNRTIALDIVVGAGQTLIIDVKRQTITLDGVNRFDAKRNDNQWWSLLPGLNTIVANRDAGNAGAIGTFTIQWRHTWV